MSVITNIDYNKAIFSTERSDIHKKNLQIASLNLEDFNRRTNLDFRLKYRPDKYDFERIKDNPYRHYFDIYCKINWFCKIWQQPFLDEWINDSIYVSHVINNYDSRKMIHNNEKELFITLFKDYFPIGFLKNSQETIIKEALNKQCQII